ncbi:FAD-dependent oxidoreductase [Akkermansiaceae bacterium]|nr:FAD-dependent oxidoreductase [Akkermansiaceae bacterium]
MLKVLSLLLVPQLAFSAIERDVIVYGGTSAGVAAAIQTSRMGKSVILIEPTKYVGGLTSGGLGMTDSGKREVIGGISREFYQRLQQHYHQPESWRQQKPADYAYYKEKDDAIWRFEPHVAMKTLREMLTEANVEVVHGQRLDLKNGVTKSGPTLQEIRMESGEAYRGKIFIDGTYEGDLMAKAGVTYAIGRESNSKYDESLNGVQTQNARSHQFLHQVDPYLIPGDPTSGLLPGVQSEGPGEEGSGDHRIQAYCFRMCLTDDPANRVAFPKPQGYDPLRYELSLRYILKGWRNVWGNHKPMPNRKTDTNNHGGFSTDNIGMNYAYPDGDYATREAIIKEHEVYQKGLFWFLCNDPRVPVDLREKINKWGLSKDEFTDNGHWPHQIYVREARRMVSDYVQSEADCFRTRQTPMSVGMGSYNMDSHHVQRYVDKDGFARNEGDVQVSPGGPYQISYRAIRPKKEECQNLLVPAALSASHIAFGSIRMEPVFMVLGQSAATGACQAIDQKVAVQDIDPAKLSARLLADKQVLDFARPPKKAPISISKLKGIVVDDKDAKLTGFAHRSHATPGYIGTGYLHNGGPATAAVQRAEFIPDLPEDGTYQIRVAYTPNANRASNVTVTVHYHGGTKTIEVDQRKALSAPLITLGVFPFKKGTSGKVTISDENADGYVIADAVEFYKKPDH